ncbi:hypothetical protein [Paenibacillus sp. FJAT-26967]|uniref:hypothetical protein n=1 Tax=Paenibacillus sp. FJAT-26967 TaxID=1729690 RepID=UPI000839A86C|nr:hypothetical protein [Paenibacillus sp. FJAT-26967]
MRIGAHTNERFNLQHVNQSLNYNNGISPAGNQKEKKDSVSISPFGRAVDSLMKQKQKIIDIRTKLIGSTLEKGGTLESIQSQLESYEVQLQSIDEQISKTLLERSKLNDPKAKKDDSSPKSEEEVQTERLHSVVSSSNNLTQIKTSSSIKARMERQTEVLESEIKIDENRGGASKFKRTELAELKNRIRNLNQSIGESMSELNDESEDKKVEA